MEDKCPKCEYQKLKTWEELNEDEKMVIRVKNTDYLLSQKKQHRFCVRCWFEEDKNQALA